jgi:antitoxin (DNA-binding transcriptional repressor) of toxin-antitoxin stability system
MLDQPSELTINATAFKARCLGLMDDLARGRLKSVRITKHGKVVAEMGRARASVGNALPIDDGKYPSVLGCMIDEPFFQPDFDIEAIKRDKAAVASGWPTPEDLANKFQTRCGHHP